jgi:hypothetical protein
LRGRFVLRAELGQQGQAELLRQRVDLLRAVSQRDRQHAGIAQAFEQCAGLVDRRHLAQAAEIQHHGRAREQIRRALHAVAHFRGQLRHVQGAHAQVGDADLAELQLAGLGVIDHRAHAHVPVGRDAWASARGCGSQGSPGRASP